MLLALLKLKSINKLLVMTFLLKNKRNAIYLPKIPVPNELFSK